MKITRIFTGADNQSHFEDLEIPLTPGQWGRISEVVPAEGVIFRETPMSGALDFHPAPRCQLVVTLSGVGEIECGDIMLAEDTTGLGHITREVQGPRRGIFIPLPPHFDVSAWRAGRAA